MLRRIKHRIEDWLYRRAVRIVSRRDRHYRALQRFLGENCGSFAQAISLSFTDWHIEFRLVVDGPNQTAKRLKESITAKNPLYEHLKAKGQVTPIDAGESIVSPKSYK